MNDRIKELTDGLNIPEKRKTDWGWIIRNVKIHNKTKEADELINLIKEEMKNEN